MTVSGPAAPASINESRLNPTRLALLIADHPVVWPLGAEPSLGLLEIKFFLDKANRRTQPLFRPVSYYETELDEGFSVEFEKSRNDERIV